MDFVQDLNIVLAGGVGEINAEDVVLGNEFHVLTAKFSIGAGVARVPRELLRDDLDEGGFFGRGKVAHVFAPHRHGKNEQQHGLEGDDHQFDVGGNFAFRTFVVGFFNARVAEAI